MDFARNVIDLAFRIVAEHKLLILQFSFQHCLCAALQAYMNVSYRLF